MISLPGSRCPSSVSPSLSPILSPCLRPLSVFVPPLVFRFCSQFSFRLFLCEYEQNSVGSLTLFRTNENEFHVSNCVNSNLILGRSGRPSVFVYVSSCLYLSEANKTPLCVTHEASTDLLK